MDMVVLHASYKMFLRLNKVNHVQCVVEAWHIIFIIISNANCYNHQIYIIIIDGWKVEAFNETAHLKINLLDLSPVKEFTKNFPSRS